MAQRPPEAIRVKGLSAGYPGQAGQVLSNISFEVQPGRCLALIGPSGCGKSSLLHVLAGLLPRLGGSISYAGREVASLKGLIGYMQQKDLLLPWRSVLDNAALGPLTQGQGKQASRAKALEGLQLFGLQDKAWSYPHQLSGGMRQRVALLRTLLCRKSIILLDEPFGALDAITRVKMHRQLLAVWNLLQASIILVTHDVDEALSLADSLLLLSASPARVLASRDIDLPRPRQTTDPGFVACKRYVLEQLTTRDRP